MEPTYTSGISAVSVTDCLDATLSEAIVVPVYISVCMTLTPPTLSYFRPSLLRPLERQLIMNLLWLESPIPLSTMSAWVTPEGRKYDETLLVYSHWIERLRQIIR